MVVKLLTEHHLEFLSFKKAAQARLSLHLSKCQIDIAIVDGCTYRTDKRPTPHIHTM